MNKKYKEYDGVVTNPYIGFTSFNHFRNGKLYSDCITGSGNIASCETESFECYPVPSGVEEKAENKAIIRTQPLRTSGFCGRNSSRSKANITTISYKIFSIPPERTGRP